MTDSKNTQPHKRFKILLIGDSCLDEYHYGTCDRLSPEAPVPVLQINRKTTKPGMAANVYENLRAFNCDVDFKTNTETIVKTRYIDSRSGQHLLRVDNDVAVRPFAHVLDLESYHAVVISDYNKGFVDYDVIESLRRHFKGPMFVDTKKTDLARLEGCYVKINSLENSLAKTLPSELIVTLGKHGARYKDIIYPAPGVEMFDVCGAGDTFLAALVVEFLNTDNIVDAIVFANQAASIAVQHSGVYVLNNFDIEQIYENLGYGP
jgi:bifunctional ADP-heptose synthase (sugar kinase/adenylyltransferase)